MAGKQRQGNFLLHKKIPWGKAEAVRGAGQAAGKKAVKKEVKRISFSLVDHQGFEPQTP